MESRANPPRTTRKTRTYLPQPNEREEILDFAEFMRDLESYLSESHSKAALINPAGETRQIPDEIFRILEQVADALANGNGVTVAPYGMLLTTQQAADFLGVSRPTLVKLLEKGEIRFQQPGRHRRVELRDLIDYQEAFHSSRQAALEAIARSTVQSRVPVIADPSTLKRRSRS